MPPVRRLPIDGPLDGVVEAAVLEDPDGDGSAPEGAVYFQGRRWDRHGSPFVADEDAPPVQFDQPPAAPEYPKSPGASGTAAASIVLAVLGFAMAWFFLPGMLVVSALGVFLGCLALRGPRRGVAIFALLFCCIVFGLGSFLLCVQIYTYIYGVTPWGTIV